MPVSIRQQNLARQAAMTPAATKEYEIVDPSHRPDMKGEFAAAPVYRRGAKQLVRLTEAQAKFYLDQGGIIPYEPEPQADKMKAAPPRR